MKKMRNKLDEMQEQKLLHVEHMGCWLAFWGLLASMFVQMALFGFGSFQIIAGEWIVFMVLALYLVIGCMKNGIWDRRLEPNGKTNFLVSLVSAVVFGAVFAIVNYVNYGSAAAAWATFVIVAVLLFVCILSALTLSVWLYKKRVQRIEDSFSEED